jgi:hypothetical protein
MSIFRGRGSPKGSYIRNTPDWYSHDLCVVGGNGYSTTPGANQVACLYNNATDGSNLYVWGFVFASQSIQQTCGQVYPSFTDSGAGPLNGTRINPALPTPPGQLYFGALPGALNFNQSGLGDNSTAPYQFYTQNEGAVVPLELGFPLIIIPPTWSFYFGLNQDYTDLYVTFWYVPMQDG